MKEEKWRKGGGLKKRLGPDGIHLFDRNTGINILVEEFCPPQDSWSAAPRQVSIALTNLCDLQCEFCYAPKHKAQLSAESIFAWLKELDDGGCLGVGFGGGEPTLHPQFSEICSYAAEETQLAATFTTHGHRLVPSLLNKISGKVDFIRVSVDGVDKTYETIRGRSFSSLLDRLREARQISEIGINVVVNEKTIHELDRILEMAHEIDASEVLLLPQQKTENVSSAGRWVHKELAAWTQHYSGKIRIAVSVAGSEGLEVCQPLPKEKGLRSYAHIDAAGFLKASSYDDIGVKIGSGGVLESVRHLSRIMEG